MDSQAALIKRLYFKPNLSGAYSGLKSFYNHRHFKIPKKDVEKELLKLKEYYLYRPALKKFKKRRVMVYFPNWILSVDLIDLQRYEAENRHYRYLVLFLDSYTKKMWVTPIKRKTGDETLKAFKKIFKLLPSTPRYIFSDLGTEFINKKVQQFLKNENVIWYSTHSHNPIIERAIGTLMGKLIRVFNHKNRNHYLTDLQSVVSNYNNSRHSSTGFSPNSVNEENQSLVFRNLYKDLLENEKPPSKPKYSVGQMVRISLVKAVHEKGYWPRYSLEVFHIHEVKPTDPVTYTLVDSKGETIKGSFYERELLPAEGSDL